MGNELIGEFEREFASMRKELGFSSTLEEIDGIFFVRDFMLKEGFVSPKLSRMVCGRMVDMLMSWAGYLQGLVIPNPGSMINMTEHNIFDEAERERFMPVINKLMAVASTNTLNGITKDRKAEAKFIDDAVLLWKELSPELQRIMAKVNAGWKQHAGQT